jgi:hypothetical protein
VGGEPRALALVIARNVFLIVLALYTARLVARAPLTRSLADEQEQV